MSPQSQEVALRQVTQSAVAQLQDNEFAEQVQLAVPEGVSPRQLLRAAATAVLENPNLAKPSLRPSLLQATLKVAQDGLLPDGREAAFVIYGGKEEKVQYLPMIGGLRKIAADHGWAINTAVVYKNDQFDPDPEEGRAHHKPTPLGEDRGEPIGAYASAMHRDGRRMLEVLTLADIEKVRQTSRAKDKGPWKDWWEQMAEKTAGRRLFKKLSLDPKDRRIASVLQAIDTADPAEALYGPYSSDDQPERLPASPALEAEDAELVEFGDVDEEPLNEPSDDELLAMGAGDVTAVDEIRFETGKFSGMTFADVYANGQVGIGYLKWALRDWKEGEFKDALREFAASHPELTDE